eukprot:Hpha_TRINITY_DN7900_c0_g1::TRINITY_DN7900_c0_g1_i1::g.146069::m.146069
MSLLCREGVFTLLLPLPIDTLGEGGNKTSLACRCGEFKLLLPLPKADAARPLVGVLSTLTRGNDSFKTDSFTIILGGGTLISEESSTLSSTVPNLFRSSSASPPSIPDFAGSKPLRTSGGSTIMLLRDPRGESTMLARDPRCESTIVPVRNAREGRPCDIELPRGELIMVIVRAVGDRKLRGSIPDLPMLTPEFPRTLRELGEGRVRRTTVRRRRSEGLSHRIL